MIVLELSREEAKHIRDRLIEAGDNQLANRITQLLAEDLRQILQNELTKHQAVLDELKDT
jgi:hypothetical protein